MTGTIDSAMPAKGSSRTFRELKPGTVDAVFDGWYPLRWCLFAEPVNVYRKTPVRLEAVLANEDVLAPGEYPVRLQVVGPGGTSRLSTDHHGHDPRSGGQARAAVGPAGLRRGRGDRRPAGQVPVPGHVRAGAAAAGGQTRVLRGRSGGTCRVEPKSSSGATTRSWPSGSQITASASQPFARRLAGRSAK